MFSAPEAVSCEPLCCASQTAKKLRGCFVFTSSAAACIVSPFTVLYAASKAFLSAFGAGLAAEVRHQGVDVLVFHPSPVATRFYDKVRRPGHYCRIIYTVLLPNEGPLYRLHNQLCALTSLVQHDLVCNPELSKRPLGPL